MKLTSLLLIVSFFQLSASVYSQNERFSFRSDNIPIRELLDKIESESHYKFLYRSDYMINSELNIDVENATLEELLSLVFHETDISYKLLEDSLVVIVPKTSMATIQQQKVTGTVTDKNGPIPGANVVVTGTTIGSITDINGKYSIDVPPGSKSLTFTFIGMQPQTIIIGTLTQIDVTMAESAIGLDEVVVVGYGTQKKVNLTGSVANINSKAIVGKTATQSSQLLAGEMSGISLRQTSGQPGSDGATIRIRGLGTFSSAGNNPLVLVDGIESSLNSVNPNDIESISVLKDAASAAIYGSKASNGVILVETKKGSGEARISYNVYFGVQKTTRLIQHLDSWDYAQALNEALANMGGSARYTEEEIQKFKTGEDPINYPNVAHYKDLFSSGSGFQNKHDINFRGGTSKSFYYISAGYLKHEGIIEKTSNDRYDLRINLESKLKDNINLKVNLAGNVVETNAPAGRNDLNLIITGAVRMPNIIPGSLPDGSYGYLETHHPEADLASGGFEKNHGSNLSSNVDLSWNLVKGLKLTGIIGYTESNNDYKYFRSRFYVNPTRVVTPSSLTNTKSVGSGLTMQSLLEYEKSFGDHVIYALGGISQQRFYSSSLSGYRDNFPNNELSELNVGSVTTWSNNGTATRYSLKSYFGRGRYSYKDRYLFETNLRYDGSSRFPKNKRYGLFPSFSAAWRISEEAFFKERIEWIDDLKIRGSWGELGNQAVGNYPFQSLISVEKNYPIGGKIVSGTAVTTVPNLDITWESTRVQNIGLDVYFAQNRINLSADHFIKTTFGILYDISVGSVLGATPSPVNAGKVENRGWDFNLSYRDGIENFSYNVAGNFSVVNNKVLELATVKLDINKGLFTGEPIGAFYGYLADGLFVDAEDVKTYPSQPYATAAPGSIRMKDISGPDGVPDGVVTALYDRKVIGSPVPTYMYGLRMGANYKNWDLYILFSGEGGMNRTPTDYEFAFWNSGNIEKWQWEERWTYENPDRNARYPRLSTSPTSDYPGSGTSLSSYWVQNASFLRLRNAQIGYTLPFEFLRKLKISKLYIYVSGQNLLTFSHYKDGWDPEMSVGSSSYHYPPTSVYSTGISIDF